jgi:F-type H+-transporting ATPase subunit b
MKKLFAIALTVSASPAFAASGPFFSLRNTDFIVLLGFLLFIGILLKFKVPALIGKALDDRAEGIRSELEEAKKLREDAQKMLASYERKQKEVQEQADRIVEQAKSEAAQAAEQAKEDIKSSVARRLTSAEEQINSAKSSAIKDVRDQAINVAIGAAQDVVTAQMDAKSAGKLIDDAIDAVGAKLH